MILGIEKKVAIIEGCKPDKIPESVLTATEPVILKGVVSDWPLVKTAKESSVAADKYIRQFYQNATVVASFGAPGIKGRVFYNSDLTGFNFQSQRVKLDSVLNQIQQHRDDSEPPLIYVGSTTIDTCLPGFRLKNDLDLGAVNPLVSIWIGNQSRIPAHYDLPENIACNVVGRRRFILFPPHQLPNLYVGPLDFTPAGQAISMLDFHNPDFAAYPNFNIAMAHAQLAELDAGDAIFIPSMWWHHVEGLSPFNVLINYWWRQSPGFMGPPIDALKLALMTIRDLPEEQKNAWRDIFNYYVFQADENVVNHIPQHSQGVLAAIDEVTARRLRAELLNKLNR